MNAIGRAVRLCDMMLRFEKGEKLTTKKMSQIYRVSSRTICRDLEDLQCDPIYAPLVTDKHVWSRMETT